MNKNYMNFTKFLTLLAMFGLTLNYFAVRAGNFEAQATPGNGDNVIICHRTSSHTNPYTVNTVDPDSIDNDGDNDHGNGDHYLNHTGPIWYQGITGDWGDIIPPVGRHNGLNWTTQGQDILNNGCNIPSNEDPTPTPSATPEVTPSPTPSEEPNCEELENCEEDPSPTPTSTPEVTPTPTPNSCDPEQFCSTSCGRVAVDLPNGSCGIKHCDPTAPCVDPNPTSTPTPEDRPIGGTSQGQVLGATTDSYAATGVSEDIAFSIIGLTGTGLSSLGILMRRNEKK